MLKLQCEDMEHFGQWLSLDLASREGKRGRRQKNPMMGGWVSWTFSKNRKTPQHHVRRTDFSFRVALLVQGWHRAGLTVIRAAERTAEYPFVQKHLGKRVKPTDFNDGVTEKDETVRQHYYKFIENNPRIDDLLELWFGSYLVHR
jgi:hypothetical protein